MVTSFIRHHIIASPIIAWNNDINEQNRNLVRSSLENAFRLAMGRLRLDEDPEKCYRPVGYIISSEKDKQDLGEGKRDVTIKDRKNKRLKRININ